MRRGSGCGDLKANREVLLCPNLGKWSYSACFVFRGAFKKPRKAFALRGFSFWRLTPMLAVFSSLLVVLTSLCDQGHLERKPSNSYSFVVRLN